MFQLFPLRDVSFTGEKKDAQNGAQSHGKETDHGKGRHGSGLAHFDAGALLRLSAWKGHQWARKVLTLMARAIAAAGRDPGGPVWGEAKGFG